jgi:hypothetical protein
MIGGMIQQRLAAIDNLPQDPVPVPEDAIAFMRQRADALGLRGTSA